MTLTSTTTKLQYNGDGSTVSFPITFIYWLNADIKVIHKSAAGVETVWVLGTQYTLTGGEGSTGTLTVETTPTDYTPASGETLTIKSIVPDTQTTTLPLGGAFPSESVEQRLDKNVRLTQQVGEELDRAMLLSEASTLSNLTFPAPGAGNYIRWNTGGTALEAVSAVNDSGNFTQSGTGAVERTVTSKIGEQFSVTDFGVVGDGITDDTVKMDASFAAALSDDNIFIPSTGNSYLTTALNTTGKMFHWSSGMYNNSITQTDPIDFADVDDAPQLIYGAIGGKHGYSYRNGSLVANDIYEPIFPNIKHYDVLNGVLQIVSGSTIEHAAAVSGYVRTDAAAPTNGVCLFGSGIAAVSSSAIWGANTLLQDNPTRVVGALTGITMIGYESDFNVMNTGTSLIGASFGGNSLSQPTSAQGVLISKLHASNGAKWTTGFSVQDNACSDIGMNLGTIADETGSQVNSCKLNFSATNAVPAKVNLTMQAIGFTTPFLQISGGDFKISASNLLLDTGQGVAVNGNVVLSDRITGYTNAMTGTANRATSYATSTITLAQLAERVKAIQDDLTTHGLIGV